MFIMDSHLKANAGALNFPWEMILVSQGDNPQIQARAISLLTAQWCLSTIFHYFKHGLRTLNEGINQRYLKNWDWDWIFGRAVKAISSLGVRSPWLQPYLCCWLVLHIHVHTNYLPYLVCSVIHNHKQHQLIPQWVGIFSLQTISFNLLSICFELTSKWVLRSNFLVDSLGIIWLCWSFSFVSLPCLYSILQQNLTKS